LKNHPALSFIGAGKIPDLRPHYWINGKFYFGDKLVEQPKFFFLETGAKDWVWIGYNR
jgi:hypothetical protein